MATTQLNKFIQHVRLMLGRSEAEGATDAQLLELFLRKRDKTAFEALIRRHGQMVWGVCHRVLRNVHDAEDAFQATFLVLVRKAASVRSPEKMLGNWLYGVAYRTALEARHAVRKRRAKEAKAPPRTQEPDTWADLRPALDHELARLPDKYRLLIVLCDLEGKTRKEAARQLGFPEGTIASRLARGRVLLARRLSRHGLSLSGGMLGVVISQNAALAGMARSLVGSTVAAAVDQAAVSAKVTALTEGVLKTMLLTKIRIATALLLAV